MSSTGEEQAAMRRHPGRLWSLWDDDSILDLVQALAPGRNDVVTLIHSYFDESKMQGTLSVGGYVFRKGRIRRFEPKWRKMLRVNHLPYFRMSACNSGAPPFDQLTEDECINAQTRAIKIIGDEASFGFCATIREEDFYAIVGRNGFVRSPYELLVWFCLSSVKEWAKADGRVSGISYFFEAGFEDHAKANNLMNKIFSDPYLKDEYRYRSHAFVEKEKSFPSQAADILAWQKCKQSVRVAAGISRKRSDFNALLERTLHKSSDLRRPQILSIISSLVKIGGHDANRIAGAALRTPVRKLR